MLLDGELHCTIDELAEEDTQDGSSEHVSLTAVIVRCMKPLHSLMEFQSKGESRRLADGKHH